MQATASYDSNRARYPARRLGFDKTSYEDLRRVDTIFSRSIRRRRKTVCYVAGMLATTIVGSGLFAVWVSRPNPKLELPDYEFERRIIVLYQEQHARTVRLHTSRYDTMVDVLQTFAKSADESELETCIALTGVLFKGFCPPDLTDPNLSDYKGPWDSKSLNDWVKRIEHQELHASIGLGGVERELSRPVDWWILFCGTVEQYDAEAARRCLEGWKSMNALLMGPVKNSFPRILDS